MRRTAPLAALALALGVAGCPPPPAQPAPPPPHVVDARPIDAEVAVAKPPDASPSDVPKLRLPRTFTATGYAARLVLDPAKPTFEGTISITGTLSERSAVIWLHGHKLAVHRATAVRGDTTALVATRYDSELIQLHADTPLEPGPITLALDYAGTIDDVNTAGAFREVANKQPYIYTQFEAIYARRVFPCIDEPDSKVPWQLTIDAPKGQQAFANTPVDKETALPDGGKRFEFAVTKPLPSYLVAFAVGAFDVVPAGTSKGGTPLRVIVPKGRAGEATYAAKTAARIVDELEDYFGMPYPYPKLDYITLPIASGFSAMENAGLITMIERYVLMDPKPSWERRSDWVRGAGHETSHQWFGDLVTMAYWDDLWLNEGFANWLEVKITSQFDPTWRGEGLEMDMRSAALDADSLVTARRVRQPIETEDDILNAFEGITYDKGASVLNMFESFVGRDVFQRGVRDYIASRAGGNATSTDFVAAISKAAGRDLAPAFATFLEQPGVAELELAVTCESGVKVTFAQHRTVRPGSPPAPATKPWTIPACVAYERNGKRAQTCAELDGPSGSFALDTKTCPRWLLPNVGGHGYYNVRLTPAQVAALRDEAWPVLTLAERRALFHDVVTAASSRHDGSTPPKLPFTAVLSLVPKLMTGGDRFTLADATSVPDLADRFVPDELRAKFEAWNRMTFGPGALKLGILPKDNDDYDAERMRVHLFVAAAWHGRDPDLVKQTLELAAKWRELPNAIRGTVLKVAVDASPELFDRVRAELKAERSRDHRDDMYAALAAVRDVKRFQQVLELVLDPTLDIRESREILFATSTEATRKLADKFVREHETEIGKRMPQDEVSGAIWLFAEMLAASCDAATRDQVVAYETQHYATKPGGERVVKNALEGLDQCIAMRSSLDPEIRGWLGGVKLPRPPATKTKKP